MDRNGSRDIGQKSEKNDGLFFVYKGIVCASSQAVGKVDEEMELLKILVMIGVRISMRGIMDHVPTNVVTFDSIRRDGSDFSQS